MNPEELQKQLNTQILDKVQEKAKKQIAEAQFFQMQDELLKKAEKKNKNLSPPKSPSKSLGFIDEKSPAAVEVDDVYSQLPDQHQLRNRSVTKRDIKQE